MKANTPTLIFLAIAAFALFTATPANAKIIYKDINPDITRSSTGITKIDVDDDGINEFEFDLNIMGVKDAWLTINTLGETKIAMADWHSQCFKSYDTINNKCGWQSDEGLPVAYLNAGAPEGPWPGTKDGFLGFAFVKDGQTFFGWMKIEVSENVKKYAVQEIAYEEDADVFIFAGDKAKPVEIVSVNEIKTQDKPADFYVTRRTLHLNLHDAFSGSKVYVSDVSGKILMQADVLPGRNNIDLNLLPAGIYCVSVLQHGRASTRKVCLL